MRESPGSVNAMPAPVEPRPIAAGNCWHTDLTCGYRPGAKIGIMKLGNRLKAWAKRIKRDGLTLWFAGKHPRTPWLAKAVGLFVVAYALSPIDLIPDFIPVLGFVDDVLLLPGLIYVAIRLLPSDVLADCRAQADAWMRSAKDKPRSKVGAAVIVAVWLGAGVAVGYWFWLRG